MLRTRFTENHHGHPARQAAAGGAFRIARRAMARASGLAARLAVAQIAFAQIALASIALSPVALAQPAAPGAGPPPPPSLAPRGPRGAAPTTEQSMLRLAEIMGSLAWLRNLCGANDGRLWRDRMTALIEAESTPPERRQRLAAAWNDSYRAWSLSYKRCTPSAELAIQRYVAEGAALSRALSARIAR